MNDPSAPAAAALLKHARKRRYEELEAAWMAAAEDDAISVADALPVLRELARQDETDRAGTLFWFFLTAQAERRGAAAGLEAARQAGLWLPDTPALRQEIAALYRRLEPRPSDLETLLEMTALRPDLSLPAALEAMERLLALPSGSYALDQRRRGPAATSGSGRAVGAPAPGRVVGVDPTHRRLAVAFEEGPATYDAQSVERLVRLAPDDFRVLAAFDCARLVRLSEEDPAELARLALVAFGPRLAWQDLRACLAPVVPAAAWSAWWSRVRPLIRRSPVVEMSDGPRPFFALRAAPHTYEEQVRARFEAPGEPEERLLAALEYLTDIADGTGEAGLLDVLAGGLARLADDWRAAQPHAAAAALALLTRLGARLPECLADPRPSLALLIEGAEDAAALIRPLRNDALVRALLEAVREVLPERWPHLFASALEGLSAALCDWAARELLAHDHAAALRRGVDALLAPRRDPLAGLVWLWRAAAAQRYPEVLHEADHARLLVRLLSMTGGARTADDDAGTHNLRAQVRQALALRDCAPVKAVLQRATGEQARALLDAVERSAALSAHLRGRLVDLVKQTHPALFVKTVPPWGEDVVYTTEAGLSRLEQALDDVLHVQVPANRKALGEAIARGDLRENAEYTAALEDRDRLTERAGRLHADLTKARLITRQMATSDTVTVGSAVRVRDPETGREETVVFLGPWDVDADRGIYSYRARVGLAFMGKRKGDRVVVQAGSEKHVWEIVDVREGV